MVIEHETVIMEKRPIKNQYTLEKEHKTEFSPSLDQLMQILLDEAENQRNNNQPRYVILKDQEMIDFFKENITDISHE